MGASMRLLYTGLLNNSPSDLTSACALFGLPFLSHPKFWFWKRVRGLDAEAAIPLHETFHFIEIPVIRFAEVRPQGPFRRDRGKIRQD